MARGAWWPSLPDVRLAPLRRIFAEATALRYEAEAAGTDFWQAAVETRRRRAGDCEDLQEIFQAAVLAIAAHEALRLAIVATKDLEPCEQQVDAWGLCWVPGVDHACVLWLLDVDPTFEGDVYLAAWDASRRWSIDPAGRRVVDWRDSGHELVWSWGLEGGGRGVWRKHFERRPA